MKYDPPNTPSAKQYAIHCQFEEEDGEEISQAKKRYLKTIYCQFRKEGGEEVSQAKKKTS